MRKTVLILAVLLSMTTSAVSFAQESETILYEYSGVSLKDSKWGPIARFQAALSGCLQSCGKPKIGVDGVFGAGTQKGLTELMSCPEHKELAVSRNDPLYGVVHSKIWKRLVPNVPEPTVHQRAFAVVLTHENTDYDRVEWNYGTQDDKSALTWGPYGATIGWGNEIRGILKILHSSNPELLGNTFGSEMPTVVQLIDSRPKDGYDLLKKVYVNASRRKAWKESLQKLGGIEYGRRAYEEYAFRTNNWLKPNLTLLYSIIPNEKTESTEIDYAFFLDLAAHTSVSGKIPGAKQAFKNEQEKLHRPLKSCERRRIIGEYFANNVTQHWRKDRRGRNVVFYVDGLPEEALPKEEIRAWKERSGLKASNFGLSDQRAYYPDFF